MYLPGCVCGILGRGDVFGLGRARGVCLGAKRNDKGSELISPSTIMGAQRCLFCDQRPKYAINAIKELNDLQIGSFFQHGKQSKKVHQMISKILSWQNKTVGISETSTSNAFLKGLK